MVLVDAYCGAGGCSEGFRRAGFTVYGIDREPMPEYPFPFLETDALVALDLLAAGGRLEFNDGSVLGLDDIHVFHGSPPCPAYSSLGSRYDRSAHPDLVDPTRDLFVRLGRPYTLENVPGAPLRNPIQLCGSSFGLDVRRHRLFESNVPLMALPCAHHLQTEPKYDVYEKGRWFKSPIVKVYGRGGGKAMEHWPEAMGIDWMSPAGLANAIPPAYCEFIGEQLISHLKFDRDYDGWYEGRAA